MITMLPRCLLALLLYGACSASGRVSVDPVPEGYLYVISRYMASGSTVRHGTLNSQTMILPGTAFRLFWLPAIYPMILLTVLTTCRAPMHTVGSLPHSTGTVYQ